MYKRKIYRFLPPLIVLLAIAIFLLIAVFKVPIFNFNRTPISSNVITWPEVKLKNKVVFVSTLYGLAVANSDGSDGKSLSSEIWSLRIRVNDYLISPDHNKVFVVTNPDDSLSQASPSADAVTTRYFVVSLDGSVTQEVDTRKISQTIGDSYSVKEFAWSSDPNKLLFVARDEKNIQGVKPKMGPDRRKTTLLYGLYDISTGSVTSIYSVVDELSKPVFYDSGSNVLVFYQYMSTKATRVDLNTKSQIEIDKPNIKQTYVKNNLYASEQGGNVVIRDYKNPDKVISTINFESQGKSIAPYYVVFSSQDTYLAVRYIDAADINKRIVKIYKIDGTEVSNPAISLYTGSIFSATSNNILNVDSASPDSQGYRQQRWTVVDSLSGSESSINYVTNNYLFAIYWYE